jgi:hypothetical protein
MLTKEESAISRKGEVREWCKEEGWRRIRGGEGRTKSEVATSVRVTTASVREGEDDVRGEGKRRSGSSVKEGRS